MIGTSRSVWGFDPRSVPGCQLWLDAADATTVTLSGSNVTQWRDKSGNGNNSTSSSATYTTGINGLGSMNNPTISGPITNSGSSIVDFFIVATLSATGSPYYNMIALNAASVVNFYAAGTLFASYYGGTNPPQFYAHMSGNLSLSSTGVVNKPYIFNAFQSGTTGTTVFNGTSQGAVATPGNTFTYTNYYIGAVQIASAWLGNIGEILVFNSVLTTSQRQQVEGYLAHKWGVTGYYDSSIPLSIPGCQLWLDAADSSTVTGTTSVTQWRDKSGNGRNTTTTGTISYANSGISITTSSSYLTGSFGSPDYTGTTVSCFIVASMNSASGSVGRLLSLGKVGTQDGDGLVSITLGRGGGLVVRTYRTIPTSSPPSIPAYDTRFIATWGQTSSLLFNSINGGALTTASLSGAFAINAYRIGHDLLPDDVAEQFNGTINEIVVYFSELTTTQRQTIEGYLMKKWGIGSSSSIPSTHPFSSIRPHLRTFQPIDVPGCALWLDAADQSSLTLSGSNVTQWRDKSGNGYIAATPSGSVTQTTSINSIPVITIGNQSYLTIPSFVQNFPYYSAFFVMRSTNTIPSGSYNFMMWANVTNLINIGIQNNSGTFSVIAGKSGGYFMIGILGDNPQNQTFLISQVTTNSTATQYINRNGSPLSLDTNVSGTLGTLTASINVGGLPFSVAIGFDIGEILIYNTGLTTTQRQQIEGYLAHKWGLSPSLPVISPLSIPGCQLWFDAADSSTVAFSSGSNVSSWTNKGIVSTTAIPTRGPSANQITYVTVDGYPGVYINNNGSIQYNASTYSQLTIQSNFQNTEDYSVFAVVNLSNVTNASLQTIYGNERGTSGETRSPNFGAGQLLEFNAAGGSRVIDLSFIGSGRLQTALISSSSALTAYTNATAYGSNTNGLTRFSTDAGPLPRIGGAFGSINDPRFATGYFHEILFYNTALTTSQRQQIEGYLARKWGISISATLPSPHPFKSILPASLHFDPSTKYSALFNTANNSHLSIPANSALTLGTNNHTIEFWLYQTSRDQYNTPFMYGNQSLFATNNYFMNVGTYIGIVVGNGGGWAINIDGGAVASLNEWHHYAIVRNGTTFTFYLNGTSRGSATSSTNITAQGNVFRIGNSASTIAGYISNFRFVNGTAVYTSNFTPPTSPLTAIPNTQILLQGLTDRSPNAFTVTNNGGVTLSTLSPFQLP